MTTQQTIPTVIIGATGYVGGELLRLVDQHPAFSLAAAISDSQAGKPVSDTFAHLVSVYPVQQFVSTENALASLGDMTQLALFSAAPHGGSAAAIAKFLAATDAHNIDIHVVDASADFRYADPGAYEQVYAQPHGAPELLSKFRSAVPEHLPSTDTAHVGHPGCFATAMQLAIVPLLRAQLTREDFFACGITGSTGAGKQPTATTHTPERHSNLFAYKPLSHRHAPEVMAQVQAATGRHCALHFVPHSGPFSRGIHMTVQATSSRKLLADDLLDAFNSYYINSPFVRVVDGMPRLKAVVASNYADIGVATDGHSVCVTVVIDNLLKGAAGGCVQWMNRLFQLPEETGLKAAAPGWT